VKIVAVTASGYPDQAGAILERGFDDYVRKPYRPGEIFECMARHLAVSYQGTTPTGQETGREPIAADLAALSPELRDELKDALLTLDSRRIAAAIERISVPNPILASVLARYAGASAYSAIFTALATAS
jgi:DNA-binding response OmpR family regulator